MKKIWILTGLLVAFVYVTALSMSSSPVVAVSGTISTDLPVYPLWGVGGTVRVTAVNFAPNLTYYLWLQKPKQILPYPLGTDFTVGKGPLPTISLTIAPINPPGTYTLTVSNSAQIDTADAEVHFGVLGTASQIYERTRNVTFVGGGFAPNSSISLGLAAGNITYPNFPRNITADAKGNYEYSFKLEASALTGTVRATITGITFDNHMVTSTYSTFNVQPAVISVRAVNATPAQVERTASVNSTYELSYPDGSPVVAANATVDIVSGSLTVADEPLLPVNATRGEWAATWVPPPSANTTLYHFTLDPTGLFDPYGNAGQSPLVPSSDFEVTRANLQPIIVTNATRERTQTAFITISGAYHNGVGTANLTRATINLTQEGGREVTLPIILSGPEATTDFKIPLNATLGNWTVGYSIRDRWHNSAAGTFTIQVIPASPVFQLTVPSSVQRTTPLDVAGKVSYPDGTGWNKTITTVISHGNETWLITPNFNSTTMVWSGSYYLVQNATLGPYNVTWSASDIYGNGGATNSSVAVIPAQFTILPKSSSATVVSFSNLDLPVFVFYPNGTALPNTFGNFTFGNVTASYQNSTGATFTLPLAYNGTTYIWHMYLTPQQGSFTFSFSAVDRFGNAGNVTNAYKLTANSAAAILSQKLILAGIIGTLIPVGVLIWAVATVSTRRRKHKP